MTDSTTDFDYDGIVIGAGISGVVAGRKLHQAGMRVLVLEARDRVGGRTLSHPIGTEMIDLGGQWIGPKQYNALRYCDEFGIETFEQYVKGKKVWVRPDSVQTYSGWIPPLSLRGVWESLTSLWKMYRMWKSVPGTKPWAAKKADEYDNQTPADFMDGFKDNGWRELFKIALNMVYAVEPKDISFLQFLFYLRSGKGFRSMTEAHGAAQHARFKKGAQQIALQVAATIKDSIKLSAPVSAVKKEGSGYQVTFKGGRATAPYVILAVPPGLAAEMELEGELAAARGKLHETMQMGSVIKFIAGYKETFWREAGFSGEAVFSEGIVRATFDDTSANGDEPALVGFIIADEAKTASKRSEKERQTLVIEQLVRAFGEKARENTSYIDKDWVADEWARGCYTALMPPGQMVKLGEALRKPVGNIHFAGTETAVHWAGYFDGAIEAGERAAAEVIAKFKS